MYVLGIQFNNTIYGITLFNNSLVPTVMKNISIPASMPYDKMVCRNNKIYISFQNQILLISMDSSLL
jgi:hypothetical protein